MTFRTRVLAFKRHATWLDKDLHGPALEVLTYCAKELDAGNGHGNMVTTFRQTWSALMADRPKDGATVNDEVEDLIEGLGK